MTNTESPVVPDPQLDQFEGSLLNALREVAATPAREQRAPRGRRPLLLAAAAALVLALAVGASFTRAGSSPAYAVSNKSNGDVVARIHRLEDAEGLKKELARHGVKAEVNFGGQTDGTMTIHPDGSVTSGDSAEVQAALESAAPAEEVAPIVTTEPDPDEATDPCGGDAAVTPMVTRDGNDFVVTIPADTAAQGPLRLTTFDGAGNAEPALVALWEGTAGEDCGSITQGS